MSRFVPVCKGCGGGACFGIGPERRDFAKNDWWCGRCIPAELATWRPQANAAHTGAGVAPIETTAKPKQFAGGLF